MCAKPHPLDPLSEDEIRKCSKIVSETYPNESWIFNSITLEEPEKSLFNSVSSVPRKAFVILIHTGLRSRGQVSEVVVNLDTERVETFVNVEAGNQPTLTPEDCFDAENIAKCDQGVVKRCGELGYTNMNLVSADPWSTGYLEDRSEFDGMRLVQLFMYGREHEDDNHYAHPFDFVVLVDLTGRNVVAIENLPGHGTVAVPRAKRNYHAEFLGENFLRTDLKPLQSLSPDGPSFHVAGNSIEWQKFGIRISFNYREGLVLHNVTYKDGNQVRPILYRASIAEMAVPYGDPQPPYHRKCAFDVSDYGLGFCTNSLELGCDCFGTIKYFDAVLNKHNGEPYTIKNAICLHEEDDGILFKHTEYRNGKVGLARSRRLVLSFIVTVVNYEYCLYWSFHLDGSIKFNVKATGMLSTNLTNTISPKHGTLVSPNVEAQFHQHIFVARIDTMIDGIHNSVSTVDVEPASDPIGSERNPYGQGFHLFEKLLRNTAEAQVQAAPEKFRYWKIFNQNSINPVTGQPVAWKLIPTNPCKLLAGPGSYVSKKAEFAKNALWVTPYAKGQRFPSGFYVLNKGKAEDGIGQWVKEDKNIDNEEIVLWHVFGMTHCPRTEDFPIMNVEETGFTLKPNNFFAGNPGLDVPRPSK